MDPSPTGSLPEQIQEQIHELRSRMRQLEETLHSYGIVVPPAGSQPQAAHPGAMQENPPQPVLPEQTGYQFAPPAFTSAEPAEPAEQATSHSLESRIGSQWFNRIGILAVLIATAWFLKLAIDNHWIGPLGRVLIGLVAGAGLIAWSERFHRRGYAIFAYSLKAVGSGILYLSLWAAFSVFHLIPPSVAFAAMILVTAFNGFMAWLQDAELLALYAIVGGLSTPLLLSTGENHEVTLFSYLLLLDLAVLVLVMLRPWSRLLFGAFLGTVLFYIGWYAEYYSDPQFAPTAFFLGIFFAIFAFAPRLAHPGPQDEAQDPPQARQQDRPRISGWNTLALVLMPIANAALGFLAFYALFDWSTTGWAGPWLAVAFAAFYLLLLRLPARGRLHANPAVLAGLHLTSAVVFLTVAIPLKAHGRWLTIGWLVEGAALLWVAGRQQSRLLRVLAFLCLALGLIALIAVNPPASTTPFFNQRFATYCIGIAVFAFVAWLASKAAIDETPESALPDSALPWTTLAASAVITVNALILLGIGWEIHSYWWSLRWHGNWSLLHNYRMYAQFTYSALFMLFGAILLAAGFSRRSAFLRWQALLLLAVSIGKVFLVDVSQLSQGYRILSFLGLGVLLLAVSFVYQRDLLKLHNSGGRDPAGRSS
jgi:uncharacterized membrane protein